MAEENHVGRKLGPYRLVELLGEGGMGCVYRALHTAIGRRVAIKMLHPALANDPVAVRRFFAEARAVNRISHENIVEIHDFVERQDGACYLVLELLVGRDLLDVMETAAPLPLSRTLAIMIQAARALAAAHAAGVVHRDLKPENIFLVERAGQPDFVKVLDFGIAKLLGGSGSSRITTAGISLGTPAYIAPEQALGAEVDHRADIYSFGVMLYELVTAQQPFAVEDVTETVARQCTHVPPRPRDLPVQVHDVPPALDDLIMQCLEKGPAMRPASMEEVEQRLEAILHQRPVERPAAVGAEARRTRAMPARRRLIAGGALAGIAALAVVGLLSLEAGTASSAEARAAAAAATAAAPTPPPLASLSAVAVPVAATAPAVAPVPDRSARPRRRGMRRARSSHDRYDILPIQ
ncbi:MAG TPA: serine/threonine-protein kinase [Kofleriaceae bacterium]|nr:serine/threonine-protein kinase [Kofleriaceae bacterium]